MKKILIYSIIILAVVALVVGFYSEKNKVGNASSPVGTYQTADVQPQITFSAVSTTTYASFYNAGPDKAIVVYYYYVPTLGASVTLQAATSTNPYDLNSNTAYIFNGTVASTSAYLSSTTPGLTSTPTNRLWPAGTYLNTVSSATTTGGGVIGVQTYNL